jgi:hypothetical protein
VLKLATDKSATFGLSIVFNGVGRRGVWKEDLDLEVFVPRSGADRAHLGKKRVR